MKGFIDRVICRGFAYNSDGTPGALAGRRVELIMLTGGDKEWYRSSGIGEALDNQLGRQTFLKYCQVAQVETIYVDNLDSGNDEQEAREAADRHLVALALKGRRLAAGTEPGAGQDAQ